MADQIGLAPSQAAPFIAVLGETLRGLSSAFGNLPPQHDLSRQATNKRLDALDALKALFRRSVFSGTLDAAGNRARVLGPLANDLDLDASEIEPGHPLPKVRSLRPASLLEEAALVPLRSALAEAAGFPSQDDEEEGGVG